MLKSFIYKCAKSNEFSATIFTTTGDQENVLSLNAAIITNYYSCGPTFASGISRKEEVVPSLSLLKTRRGAGGKIVKM